MAKPKKSAAKKQSAAKTKESLSSVRGKTRAQLKALKAELQRLNQMTKPGKIVKSATPISFPAALQFGKREVAIVVDNCVIKQTGKKKHWTVNCKATSATPASVAASAAKAQKTVAEARSAAPGTSSVMGAAAGSIRDRILAKIAAGRSGGDPDHERLATGMNGIRRKRRGKRRSKR